MHALYNRPFLISQNAIFLSLAAIIMMFAISAPAFGQDAPSSERPKPKLVSVSQLLADNDTEAMAIAEKINPEFFIVDEETFGDNAFFSAQFISLSSNQPRRFLGLTVTDTAYYCTSYGCPYYIYENKGDNRWSLALSVQALSVYYDSNSVGSNVSNIITQSIEQASSKTSVWLWNGQHFQKVERK